MILFLFNSFCGFLGFVRNVFIFFYGSRLVFEGSFFGGLLRSEDRVFCDRLTICVVKRVIKIVLFFSYFFI